MSDLSGDFKNDNLSGDVDITSSSGSTDSSGSSDRTVSSSEQLARTLDYLSNVYDFANPKRLVAPTGHAWKGVPRLRKILKMGPTTRPNCSFMDDLNGVQALVQPSPVMDLIEDEDAVTARTAR